MTDTTLKTVQALASACNGLLERYRVMGCGDGIEAQAAAIAIEAGRALIAQMQRDAAQPVAQDERIDALLSALDEVARDHDSSEYGLPMYCNDEGGPLQKMREIVRTTLAAPHPEVQAAQPSIRYGTTRDAKVFDTRAEAEAYLLGVPYSEAQALDSQLQQPDADSTRASGVCASTTPLPEGWTLTRHADGGIVVWKEGLGGYAATENDKSIAVAILWELANDLLDAAPSRRSLAGDQKQDEQAESASPSVLLIRGEK